MKTHLTIDNGKRVTGECRLSAVKRKDGALVQRMTLTSVVSDDAIGDTVFAGPLHSEHDRFISIRKGENKRVVGLDVVATMPAIIGRVHVWPLTDGKPGDRYTPPNGLEGAIRKLRATAGNRHTKQVAVIDIIGTADELGPLLDAQDCEVAVRVKLVQGDLFDADDEGESDEDLPAEAGDEQLDLSHLPADEQEAARENLEPAKPGRKKRATGAVDVEVSDG